LGTSAEVPAEAGRKPGSKQLPALAGTQSATGFSRWSAAKSNQISFVVPSRLQPGFSMVSIMAEASRKAPLKRAANK